MTSPPLSRKFRLLPRSLLLILVGTSSYGVSHPRRTNADLPSSYHKCVSCQTYSGFTLDAGRSDIRLEPSTSNYDVSLKILVDGQVARRLALIKRGGLLSWNRALS